MDLSIPVLRQRYLSGTLCPATLLAHIHDRISATTDANIWISLIPDAVLAAQLRRLENCDAAALPLYGIPFAVKDNIDIADVPTTAACPGFSYIPSRSAFAVDLLMQAGAIPVGKTNMDQFATGLVGTRSPFGATRNSLHPAYISGGSSSGSAVAVALGQASFALGTDTAGSGRVPAAFNQLVGYKPTRGLIGMTGVVPACRTLDCLSVFTNDIADAGTVLGVLCVEDNEDAFSRHGTLDRAALARALRDSSTIPEQFTFGVPAETELHFFGHGAYRERFQRAVARLENIGGIRREIDFNPFLQAAGLLYGGPWIAERYLVARKLLTRAPEALLPEIRMILARAEQFSALDVYTAQYRLQELKLQADRELQGLAFIVTPTTGGCFTLDEVKADPIHLNSNLGYYTNFMNLLDYAALAIPGDDHDGRLPFGLTLFGPAGSDLSLLRFGEHYLRQSDALHAEHARPAAACLAP